ncbi:hypothetical protein [Candidatus Binatus sp.]|uniref:hypothetical protein n=1 Tax=Candidatus Binatus sp. TaxID=2811406 RepID=UPI003C78EA98
MIKKYSIYAIDISVGALPFRILFGNTKSPYNKPHAIAYSHLVTWILGKASERTTREKIHFIFDQGVLERESEITEAYVAMMKHLPPEMTSLLDKRPSFEDDKAVGALQAADLWAWHVRRQYNQMTERRPLWTSPIWSALTEIHMQTIPALNADYLAEYKRRLIERGAQF